jgi:putative sterol carrier protein
VADINELIQGLVAKLGQKSPAVLQQSDGVYQFHLTGEGGGDWALIIAGGVPRVEAGTHANPGVTVSMAAQDFQDLVAGRLNAMTAFMSGKLQVTGNMGLAMKLSSLI